MEKDTQSLIKEAFDNLPQELKDAVTASDLQLKMKTIANTHGLLIDQLGGLQNEILLVLLGVQPSSSFVDNLAREIGVPREKAFAIAEDTNKLIFDSIREHLMEWEENMQKEEEAVEGPEEIIQQKENVASSIEKIGGISIENSGFKAKVAEEKEANYEASSLDRETVLKGIENTNPSTAPNSSKINVLESSEKHVDPLIDHLLTTSVVIPQQKIVRESADSQKIIPIPKKNASSDLYREPIE